LGTDKVDLVAACIAVRRSGPEITYSAAASSQNSVASIQKIFVERMNASLPANIRLLNPLTSEWILVSPHHTQRPWQGQRRDFGISASPIRIAPAI